MLMNTNGQVRAWIWVKSIFVQYRLESENTSHCYEETAGKLLGLAAFKQRLNQVEHNTTVIVKWFYLCPLNPSSKDPWSMCQCEERRGGGGEVLGLVAFNQWLSLV